MKLKENKRAKKLKKEMFTPFSDWNLHQMRLCLLKTGTDLIGLRTKSERARAEAKL